MLLGFKQQFIQPIESGTKIHTLRDEPKRMPKLGETLYMYTGLRTKKCKLIRKDLSLHKINKVELFFVLYSKQYFVGVLIDGILLSDTSKRDFFINDGFESQEEFTMFWDIPSKSKCDFHDTKYMFSWVNHNYTGIQWDLVSDPEKTNLERFVEHIGLPF